MTAIPRHLHVLIAASVAALVAMILAVSLLQVEVVVSGTGRLVPEGQVGLVQPRVDGRIIAVQATNGDRVRQGDVLAAMDDRNIRAELNILSLQDTALQDEALRLRLQGQVLSGQLDAATAQDRFAAESSGQPGALVLMTGVLRMRDEQLAILQARIAVEEGALNSLTPRLANVDQRIALYVERLATLKLLESRGATIRADLLEAEEQMLRLQSERQTLLGQQETHLATISQLRAERTALDGRLQTEWLQRQSEIAASAAELRERIRAIEAHLSNLQIVATMDGTLTDMLPGLAGRVVSRGEPIMTIVPDGQRLLVEADIASADIGFVRQGQAAGLKIDAFPFQRFGIFAARVVYVAADAVRGETGQWQYRVLLELSAPPNPQEMHLKPGMTAQVDLVVGRRRVLTYLLGPILKLFGESFREI